MNVPALPRSNSRPRAEAPPSAMGMSAHCPTPLPRVAIQQRRARLRKCTRCKRIVEGLGSGSNAQAWFWSSRSLAAPLTTRARRGSGAQGRMSAGSPPRGVPSRPAASRAPAGQPQREATDRAERPTRVGTSPRRARRQREATVAVAKAAAVPSLAAQAEPESAGPRKDAAERRVPVRPARAPRRAARPVPVPTLAAPALAEARAVVEAPGERPAPWTPRSSPTPRGRAA